ncbi:hypothetical protein JXB28_05530 [Candidatus Woesearchaeota archaeon]|nr:hypothetical protein [Candidatus Woesearchaeota archaeon]
MVTTQLDFLHLRTTAGLAQQVRRVAGRMKRKNFPKHIAEEEEKLKTAIEKGEIDSVNEAFDKLLKFEEKEEHYLYLIEKDELVLLNEEEKIAFKEKDIENQLKPFIAQLQDEKLMAEFQKKVDEPLAKVCYDIHARTDQIRRVLAYLKEDNVAGVSRQDFINSLRSERGLERTIRREARLEKKYAKHEKSGIEKLYGLFKEITDDIKQNKRELALKKLHEFMKKDQKIFDEMKAEADYIYDIILKGTYLYVKLLEFIKDKLPAIVKQLEDEKFPETELAGMKKEVDEWFKELWNHINNIYSLARYQEIRAR